MVPSHPEPSEIRWHFFTLDLTMVDICKHDRHARKQVVAVIEHELQRSVRERDQYVWLSRLVSCAQKTRNIVAILSRRETHEVKIFRENFQVPPVRAR